MRNIAIVSAKRTPIGRYKGKLRDYSAVELGTAALKAAVEAIDIDPSTIQQVIFGNVLQSGLVKIQHVKLLLKLIYLTRHRQ